MQVVARVPMRVDLAGGTLDVYPLYVFEGGGLTLNAAISLYASVSIRTRPDHRITLHSTDLDYHEEADGLEALSLEGPLSLVHHALEHYRPEPGLDIIITSEAPQGSGLGASSALLMALSAALCRIDGQAVPFERLIDVGANIEARVLGIPTGKQDYFPPLYGGLSVIWFGLDGWKHETFRHSDALIRQINDRLVVSYTGIPHSSAATNWAMLKGYIERQGDTVERIREIKEIALEMRAALDRGDLSGFGVLLSREWNLRRGLADNVTTPEIDRMVTAAARAGATSSKICGAGGGGCMTTLVEPAQLPAARQALVDAGATILPATLVGPGLSLEVRP
ncbi:MAG: hypothetical protein GXX94_01905 [Chloroflexi bacterium]|nr:hypothetical protein [Chloroflexota bacterium]